MRVGTSLLVTACLAMAACGSSPTTPAPPSPTASPPSDELDRVVDIGGRGLYIRCEGNGSPTVVMEAGDADTSGSYAFAVPSVSAVTRTCVYDRANLGRSDPAPGPRGLQELVDDLDSLIEAAEIPGPYVLVGTSGGGYVDTAAPFRDPPPEIVEETRWDNPANVERRDYLQVEKDAWAGRTEIGDIPVTIVSVEYSADELEAAGSASERDGLRRNVQEQQGWLVLSPRAEQLVVPTGHAVEEEDPDLVIQVILDVVEAAG